MSRVFGSTTAGDIACNDLTVRGDAEFLGTVNISGAEFIGETLTNGSLSGTTTLDSGHTFSGLAEFSGPVRSTFKGPGGDLGAIQTLTGGAADIRMGFLGPGIDQRSYLFNANTSDTLDFGLQIRALTGVDTTTFSTLGSWYSLPTTISPFTSGRSGLQVEDILNVKGEIINAGNLTNGGNLAVTGDLVVSGSVDTEQTSAIGDSKYTVAFPTALTDDTTSAFVNPLVGEKGTFDKSVMNQSASAVASWNLRLSAGILPRRVKYVVSRASGLPGITVAVQTFSDDTFATPSNDLITTGGGGGGSVSGPTASFTWPSGSTMGRIELIPDLIGSAWRVVAFFNA